MRTTFTNGGVADFSNHYYPAEEAAMYAAGVNENREGYYGWYGYGGSVF